MKFCRGSKFGMFVGLVVGVMVLAPSALAQLGALRAAQSETNERAEYETNERAHSAGQQVRCSKCKGSLIERNSPHPKAADSLFAARYASEVNLILLPTVVHWTATMRC